MDKPNLYVVEGGVGKHLQFTSLIEGLYIQNFLIIIHWLRIQETLKTKLYLTHTLTITINTIIFILKILTGVIF